MAGSTRTFECVIQADADVIPRLIARAQARACESNDQVTCHGIGGEALGVVTMSVTVTGRDQWACRQIVQDVVNYVTWGLSAKVTRLDLQSRRQPAHTHRGYSFGRVKRFREPRPPRPPRAPAPGSADAAEEAPES